MEPDSGALVLLSVINPPFKAVFLLFCKFPIFENIKKKKRIIGKMSYNCPDRLHSVAVLHQSTFQVINHYAVYKSCPGRYTVNYSNC